MGLEGDQLDPVIVVLLRDGFLREGVWLQGCKSRELTTEQLQLFIKLKEEIMFREVFTRLSAIHLFCDNPLDLRQVADF